MSEMEKILQNWDTADEYLNSKIEEVKDVDVLTSIVANSKVSVMNSKTIEINGTGKAIEKLVLEGKTEQNGTPSPSNPVEVKGIGVKTQNLFPINEATVTASSGGYAIGSNSTHYPFSLDTGTYIISYTQTATSGQTQFSFYDSSGTNKVIDKTVNNTTTMSVELAATKPVTSFTLYSNKPTEIKEIMIRKALDTSDLYEPYGKYKISGTVGDTTKNVYIDSPLFDGEKADLVSGVASRKWGVMTFDGTQSGASLDSSGNYRIPMPTMKPSSRKDGYCDKFVPANSYGSPGTVVFGTTTNNLYFTMPSGVDTTSIATVNAWFAANPTTVVYPLATDTEETFEGIELPTTVGKNTLTIGTEVTPASIEVTTYGDYYSKAEVDKKIAETKEIAGGDLVWFYLDTNKQALQLYEGNKRDTCYFPVISSYMEKGGEAYPVTGGILRLYTLDSLNYYAQIQGVERNCTSQNTVISTHMTFKFTPNAKLLLGIPKPCIEEFGILIVDI